MAVVNVVVADPKQGGTGYAGTASGRVHKTTDEGKTWAQVLLCDAEVTALWIDAQFNHKDTPDTAIILVGTSNGKLYRSGDSGATFAQKTAFPGTGSIKYLISDPRNPLRWYILSGSALYLTDSNGASFTILYDFGAATAEDAAWSYWTEFLVALSGSLGSNTPAMHSSNDGKTFATGLGLAGVAGLSAISMSPFEKTEALALEKNSNRTWKVSAASGDTYTWSRAADLEGYGQCMRVDGDMHAVVFAGTNQKLMKSVDFGDKFYVVKDNVDVRYISLGPLRTTSPTRLYFWTIVSGGVQRFRVLNDGSLETNGRISIPYSVAAIRAARYNPNICYIVCNDSGTFRVLKTTDGLSFGEVWSQSGFGSLTVWPDALYVSPTNPSRVLFGTKGSRTDPNVGVWGSTNGTSFTKLGDGRYYPWVGQAWMTTQGIWGVHEATDGTIWTWRDPTKAGGGVGGTAYYFSKSIDGGATWTDLAPYGSAWDIIGSSGVAWSDDGQKMFAYRTGAGGGSQYWRSADGGQTFSFNGNWPPGNAPTNGNNASISFFDTSRWILKISNGVYISADSGLNWTLRQNLSGLYDSRAILCDGYNADTFYVFAWNFSPFVWRTTNQGAAWSGMAGATQILAASICYGRM